MTDLRVPVADVPDGEAVRLAGGPTGVCLVRIAERYYAIGDRCSHADVSLADGDIDVEDCWIECWKHGSAFSLVDGTPQSLPATAPVPVYPVAVDGDTVVVTLP
jgi:3-phenylpropionate/trans-cinnamate dioxygenase ferredoxin subunit